MSEQARSTLSTIDSEIQEAQDMLARINATEKESASLGDWVADPFGLWEDKATKEAWELVEQGIQKLGNSKILKNWNKRAEGCNKRIAKFLKTAPSNYVDQIKQAKGLAEALTEGIIICLPLLNWVKEAEELAESVNAASSADEVEKHGSAIDALATRVESAVLAIEKLIEQPKANPGKDGFLSAVFILVSIHQDQMPKLLALAEDGRSWVEDDGPVIQKGAEQMEADGTLMKLINPYFYSKVVLPAVKKIDVEPLVPQVSMGQNEVPIKLGTETADIAGVGPHKLNVHLALGGLFGDPAPVLALHRDQQTDEGIIIAVDFSYSITVTVSLKGKDLKYVNEFSDTQVIAETLADFTQIMDKDGYPSADPKDAKWTVKPMKILKKSLEEPIKGYGNWTWA